MELLKDFDVSGEFTKVPNCLTRPDHPLWKFPGAMQLYLQLLSLSPRKGLEGQQHLANLLGINLPALRKNLARLRDLGFVTDEMTLSLPGGKAAPVCEPEKLIAQEVAAKPKRKPTELSREDRWEKIKKAWNDNRPETYVSLKGGVNLPLYLAIETHTASLEIDRDDYDTFIGAVLRGAKADPWWAEKDFKATAVFGFGTELEDRKFENVEKLYRAGLATMPRVEKLVDFWSDDDKLVAWYRSTGPAPEGLRIERITVENESEAKDLEDWHRYSRNEPTRGNEVLYYRRLKALVQGGKLNYSAERFTGAARLYYQEGKPNPIWWTDRYNMPQPPIEN